MAHEKQCEFFHKTQEAGYAGTCSAFDRLGTERYKPCFVTYDRFCECDSGNCGYNFYGKSISLKKWLKN